MYTIKLDKRGKILIPARIRKHMGIFTGQKFSLDTHYDHYGACKKIELIPFKYKCVWCGIDIPEGEKDGICEECAKKNTKRIY